MPKKHIEKVDVSAQIEAAYQKGLAEGNALRDTAIQRVAALQVENAGFVQKINELNIRCLDLIRETEQTKAKLGQPVRRRLPDTRRAVTHKFTVGGHEGYMTVGMFDDGSPGELFITMAKEGSTIGGLMDTIGTLTSIALQYGVSMEILSGKFSHQRFEPSGWTPNPEIKMASSIIDYVFRWMEIYFIRSTPVMPAEPPKLSPPTAEPPKEIALAVVPPPAKEVRSDGPPCPKCGAITRPSGKCHLCPNCGETTGCS